MPKPRARQDEEKHARREAILMVASALFEETPFQAITMAQVAERAGLAKGTLYLYFRTKEELFLAMLEEEQSAWFSRLDGQLTRAPDGLPAEALAGLIGASLEDGDLYLQLLGLMHTVLAQNAEPERMQALQRLQDTQRASMGARLESRLPGLSTGQGARLLMRAQALVLGLSQLAIRQDGALAVSDPALAREVSETLTALIAGMARSGGAAEPKRVEGKSRAGQGRSERPWG